jgi:hypothetical protein
MSATRKFPGNVSHLTAMKGIKLVSIVPVGDPGSMAKQDKTTLIKVKRLLAGSSIVNGSFYGLIVIPSYIIEMGITVSNSHSVSHVLI